MLLLLLLLTVLLQTSCQSRPVPPTAPASDSLTFTAVTRPYIEQGVPYVASTLEPDPVPADPDSYVEPLVIRTDAVDCTTFVEYVTAALLSGTVTTADSTYRATLQQLRYRQGKRGNYATRKHYFSEWISEAEDSGMLTEVTPRLTGAQSLHQRLGFMTANPRYYPQLAASPALLQEVRRAEAALTSRTVHYVPTEAIAQAYPGLRHGDIVAFVTDRQGLDIQHVGFVWWPDSTRGEPHFLHASSSLHKVVISDATLAQYAQTAKHCMGLRIMRLQRSPLSRIE